MTKRAELSMNWKLECPSSGPTPDIAFIAVPAGWAPTRADENRLVLLPEHPERHTTNGFTANVVATLYPIDQVDEDPAPAVLPLTMSSGSDVEVRSSTIGLDQIAGGELTQLIDQRTRGEVRLSIVCSAASEAWGDVAEQFDQIVDRSGLEPATVQEARS